MFTIVQQDKWGEKGENLKKRADGAGWREAERTTVQILPGGKQGGVPHHPFGVTSKDTGGHWCSNLTHTLCLQVIFSKEN